MTDHDDFNMAYFDTFNPPALFLIHGFPLNMAIWQPQVEDLDDIVRIIAPDLRGHGQSTVTPPPYTIAQLATDCIDLLDLLGIDNAIFCGHSMGGYIAFELWRQYPERVAGLILNATRAAADDQQAKSNRDKMIATVEKKGVEPVAKTLSRKLLDPTTYDIDPDLAEELEDIMLEADPNGVIGSLAAMRDRPDSMDTLATITVPTLVIHGRDDQIVPHKEAEAMAAAIPNAEFVTIDHAGHMPHLEQPGEFNTAVYNFIERVKELYD
ncbi:MAG TPA: alpha/beta fold hydrolase [Anaerolineae bacterium]|nr:alpha/beta fold hydrolase [Anaerolineae bacterium]